MKNVYGYLFYKMYRFSENAPSKWMSDWKASLSMDVLIAFIFLSVLNYCSFVKGAFFDLGNGGIVSLLGVIIICVPNYLIFNHKDRWEKVIKHFDHLPQNKNRIGGFLVLFFILIVLVNLLFSFYLLSLIKKS